ncbi:peroxiredoxin [Aquimarina brevivitae]|uniref:thioredoxin-dependent peroxiredoxin n=1 Tax=Aquimarina brevivitae TaxID=323412 RepID=A0A4Q7P0C7_9FLAO|nr:peroxiredoxin [Aquimarina brevivitae]RZS93104.1 peroxiredoxin Q/BCP [Aquimarina brevivitae]
MSLQEGDKVDHFSCKDDNGATFESTSLLGKKVAVVYFYPKNFTPGCTKEACDFRDHYTEFKELGAEVIAVSSDSASSHQKFKTKYRLPFIFLADKDGQLRKLFGVKSSLLGLLPGRETFVIDKNGVLRYRFNSLNASKHMSKALSVVKQIADE